MDDSEAAEATNETACLHTFGHIVSIYFYLSVLQESLKMFKRFLRRIKDH